MAVYEYIALDAGGRRRKGIVDAGSVAAARQKLRETDVFPVELSEASERKQAETAARRGEIHLFRRVGLQELALMTRQLATLLGAGLPLVPSLSALVAQIRSPLLKTTLAQIREEVNEGNSLTQSMSHFPRIFPPFYINMVRAGEASGTVNLVLDRLADFQEGQQALRTKIRSALAYPLFMFLIGSGVLFFLVTFVVPNITNIFREMHQTLPGITVFLIVVSGALKSLWWIIALVLLSGIVGIRYAIRKTDQGRRLWDRFKLNAPLFGNLNRKIVVARFSRTLGTLLQSSVPLLAALEIAWNVVDNLIVADEIRRAAKEVEEGQNLSAPLSRSGFFPPIAVEMISVGEQSGNMETMLFRVADAYEKEVEANIILVTSLLEPAMILVMGAVVGFIVVSVLLPIFEMNQLVR
ncbi:MAG: type II secretion system inner membrane protein GspF [Deltaproteobacteria bacterium]|nr:type II secretion system inner membrane protein GspF [Deltaproteobacteria bacterium]